MTPIEFIHDLKFEDLPPGVLKQAELCLLDLVGIGLGGATTRLSSIIRDHAASQFMGTFPLLFDGRGASAAGFALAGGLTIDALDGHDGFNLAKGHVGCGLFPAALAIALEKGDVSGKEFLTAIVLGYELGSRLGPILHDTVPDYHTSGAWVAVAAAAAGSRLLGLSKLETEHALGIAEYHGPRSQMMRCIDHPTMLKDGSGWGAMAGVSATLLAQNGFTGAPALTMTEPHVLWSDLGSNWLITQQYFKPYPVCRWAHAPVEAALKLQSEYGFRSGDIDTIEIATFHECTRLAASRPKNTEEAQYSTSFPVAVALAKGEITAETLADDALQHEEVLRLSDSISMHEDETANLAFPEKRRARVTICLKDGTKRTSDWHEPKWDANNPPTESELRAKFRGLSEPLIGETRAREIEDSLSELHETGISRFVSAVTQPINAATKSSN